MASRFTSKKITSATAAKSSSSKKTAVTTWVDKKEMEQVMRRIEHNRFTYYKKREETPSGRKAQPSTHCAAKKLLDDCPRWVHIGWHIAFHTTQDAIDSYTDTTISEKRMDEILRNEDFYEAPSYTEYLHRVAREKSGSKDTDSVPAAIPISLQAWLDESLNDTEKAEYKEELDSSPKHKNGASKNFISKLVEFISTENKGKCLYISLGKTVNDAKAEIKTSSEIRTKLYDCLEEAQWNDFLRTIRARMTNVYDEQKITEAIKAFDGVVLRHLKPKAYVASKKQEETQKAYAQRRVKNELPQLLAASKGDGRVPKSDDCEGYTSIKNLIEGRNESSE